MRNSDLKMFPTSMVVYLILSLFTFCSSCWGWKSVSFICLWEFMAAPRTAHQRFTCVTRSAAQILCTLLKAQWSFKWFAFPPPFLLKWMSSLCCELDGQETASLSWPRSPCTSPPRGVTLVCRGGRKKQEHPRKKGERNNRVHVAPIWDAERRQKLNRIRKYQTSLPMLQEMQEMQATRATCLPAPECANC